MRRLLSIPHAQWDTSVHNRYVVQTELLPLRTDEIEDSMLARIATAAVMVAAVLFAAPTSLAASAGPGDGLCDKKGDYGFYQQDNRLYAYGFIRCDSEPFQPLDIAIQIYVPNEDGSPSAWSDWARGSGNVSINCPDFVSDFRHSVTKQRIRCRG